MGGSSRVSSYEDAQRALSARRDSSRSFAYSDQATRSGVGSVHASLNPKNVVRECVDTDVMPNITPIALMMDVTRSRGQDAKIIHGDLLPFLGALHLAEAAPDPQLLFGAFGDAKSDRAPLQVGQFESDDRMDHHLERIWLEEGGGGTGEESAELAAYFLSRKTKVDAIDKRGMKGLCFFTSDEAPYPFVSAEEVKRIIGDDIGSDIPTPEIFAELQKRWRVFLLYPGKSLEDRKDDIDAEIRQRLLKAGGRFENCSIRASLIWDTYDDLDLHVVTPDRQEIFFGNRRSTCGGELDVDRNAGGRETREPVENIRWVKGGAKPGKYVVFVRNYAHHEHSPADINFRVELDVDGKVQTFNGVAKKGITGPASDVTAFEFDYLPEEAVKANTDSREAYTDEVILGKWRQCIPDGNIIRLNDARSTSEAMIAVMSIQNGGKSIEDALEDMRVRAVDQAIIDDVQGALKSFAAQAVVDEAPEAAFA